MKSCYVCLINNHRVLVKEINEEIIVVEGLRHGRPTLIYLFILISHFSVAFSKLPHMFLSPFAHCQLFVTPVGSKPFGLAFMTIFSNDLL